MPWKSNDAKKHTKKATTPKLRKMWANVANSTLKQCMADGGSSESCESRAVRAANSAIAREVEEMEQENLTQEEQEQTDLGEYGGDIYPDFYSSATSFADLEAEQEAQENVDTLRDRVAELGMILRNIIFDREIEDKAAATRAVFDEFLDVAGMALEGEEMQEVASALSLEELDDAALEEMGIQAGNPRRFPVLVDFAIIKPGFGNERDNRYYSAGLLERDGHVFEGVPVYATNHLDSEKSERTKVGKVRRVKGLSEDGLVGQFLIYDPDQAEKTRNRADAGELHTLECSIYALGSGKQGKVEGRDAFIVEHIGSAGSVDLVSKAGAGGHALSLSEMEGDGNMTDPKDPTITEGDEEEITIEEQAEPEQATEEPAADAPDQEQPEAPEADPEAEPVTAENDPFSPEAVAKVLDETDLTPDARTWVLRGSYSTQEELDEAIAEMREFIKGLTSSAGRPFALGESEQVPAAESTVTREQLEKRKRDRFLTVMSEVDPNYAARMG